MRDEGLLVRLEVLAEQLGVPVRYAGIATEESAGEGGACTLRGHRSIIIERTLPPRRKAELLARALADFDLEGVFVLPAVREMLDRARRVRPEERGGPALGRSAGKGNPSAPA